MALFVTLPHSGLKIPPEASWLKGSPFEVLMCDPDAFVDELYHPALVRYYIPFFIFDWHRYSVDANRFPFDISSQTVERAGELLKNHYKLSGRISKVCNEGERLPQAFSKKTQSQRDKSLRALKKKEAFISSQKKQKNRILKVLNGRASMENLTFFKSPSDIHWKKTTLGTTLIRRPLSQKHTGF